MSIITPGISMRFTSAFTRPNDADDAHPTVKVICQAAKASVLVFEQPAEGFNAAGGPLNVLTPDMSKTACEKEWQSRKEL